MKALVFSAEFFSRAFKDKTGSDLDARKETATDERVIVLQTSGPLVFLGGGSVLSLDFRERRESGVSLNGLHFSVP